MLEIIAETIEDAKAIEKGGADRIELVSALALGGLTPSVGLVKGVLETVHLPVNIMIRPHDHGFIYTQEELTIMRDDVEAFHRLGAEHVVLGILNEEGDPDIKALEYVLGKTPVTATFHRALDDSRDLLYAMESLGKINRVTHVLTSGGPGKAEENLSWLKHLPHKEKRIIVASGVTLKNLDLFKEALGGAEESFVYDVHVGTGAREQGLHSPVSPSLVHALAEKVRSL